MLMQCKSLVLLSVTQNVCLPFVHVHDSSTATFCSREYCLTNLDKVFNDKGEIRTLCFVVLDIGQKCDGFNMFALAALLMVIVSSCSGKDNFIVYNVVYISHLIVVLFKPTAYIMKNFM